MIAALTMLLLYGMNVFQTTLVTQNGVMDKSTCQEYIGRAVPPSGKLEKQPREE